MGHSDLWLFNMHMCCSMQVSSLREKLEECKRLGKSNCVVGPKFPAASREDYLFDCMDIFATLKEDGQVIVEGIVFYNDDKSKSVVIQKFSDIDECLAWISNEYTASDDCVKMLNENC